MLLKDRFYRRLKRHAAGQLFLDVWPGYAPLRDGNVHRLPGKVRELIAHWKDNETLEDESRDSYEAYQGGSLFDVGSFDGWYPWLLAPKAAPGDRFVCCEPDEWAANHLLRNLASFSKIFPKIRVSYISQPIGNGGAVTVWNTGHGHPQFGSDLTEEGPHRTLTLDALSATLGIKPAFVKIDVEGAEGCVLQGMERLMDEVRPIIMIEIHPTLLPQGVTPNDVRALMIRHGYRGREDNSGNVAIREIWK